MFTTHQHKTQHGYYINHDLLMAVSEENKAKLITYHIAMNSPQKLDPQDRYKILNKMNGSLIFTNLVSIFYTGAIYSFSKNRNKFFMVPFLYNAFYHCIHDIFEKKMLKSDLLSEMSIKYKFSTFDFHNSKKESQLGALVSQIKNLPRTFQNI